MKIRLLTVFLVIIFLASALKADLKNDLDAVANAAGLHAQIQPSLKPLEKPNRFGFIDQIKFPFFGLLFLYQNFISTQQGEVCMFEPSCSEFTKQALRKYGLKGVIMGADRIQRCNGMGSVYYDKPAIGSELIYDPIERYDLENK